MLDQNDIDTIVDRDVYGSDGSKIGAARQVYVDDETGRPEWVTVRTGLFGTSESFVPLADATVSGDRVVVPYDKSFVKDAPNLREDGHLTPEQERELYAYYGRSDSDTDAATALPVARIDTPPASAVTTTRQPTPRSAGTPRVRPPTTR